MPSFAEYVGARWVALLRVAHLLTGDPASAEDLVQATLVKVCVAWARVSRAESIDAYVRKMLLNEFLGQERRSSRRDAKTVLFGGPGTVREVVPAEERIDLWARVVALPPRQRAVLVLRYYEDLTEAETAHVLGIFTGTVTCQAHAALNRARGYGIDATGDRGDIVNQHERDLADLLRRQAESTTLTAAPLDAITAEARVAGRRRIRNIGLVAMGAAGAVVAAIAIPLGVLHAATGSAPAPIGPVGPSTAVPSTSSATPDTTPHATDAATDTAQNTAERIIAAARVPYATAVSSTGEVASLWDGCHGAASCGTAWMLTSGARTMTGIVSTNGNSEDEQLVDGGDGFLVVSDDSEAPSANFVLDYGGSTTPLRRDDTLATDPADPMYDGTAVYRDNGQSVWVASAKLDTWAPLVTGGSQGSSIGPALIEGETAWVGQVVDGKPVLRWLPMHGSWHSHPLLSTSPYFSPGFHDLSVGQIAVARGGMIAAISLLVGDDRDPLVGLSVSHDGGTTWTDIPGTSLPFVDDGVAAGATPPPHAGSAVDVFDMAATTDGTLFVDTWNGRLYRSTDHTWTRFAPVAGMTNAEYLQPLGDDAVAVTEPTKGSVTIAKISSNRSARTIIELGAKARQP